MLSFQNRAPDIKLPKIHANAIMLTLKNVIFNRSSFANSDATIGFVTSKQVRKWSRILISSPCCSYTQKETNFLLSIHNLSRKKCDFLQMTSNIGILHTVGKYFLIRIWIWDHYLKNKVLFGLDPLAKYVVFARKCMPMIWTPSSRMEGTILKRNLSWAFWHRDWSVGWPKNGGATSWTLRYTSTAAKLAPHMSLPSELI